MKKLFLHLGFFAFLGASVNAFYVYYNGQCPAYDSLIIDMDKLLGLWYMTDSFERSLHCVTWNITKVEFGVYEIREVLKHGVFFWTTHYDKGRLLAKDKYIQNGAYTIEWESNPFGPIDFTLLFSDPEHSFTVLLCQNILANYRLSGLVFSRIPIGHSRGRQMGKSRTLSIGISPFYYEVVMQNNCGYPREEIVQIEQGPLERVD